MKKIVYFLHLLDGRKTYIFTIVSGLVGMLGTMGYISEGELASIITVLALIGKVFSYLTKRLINV